MLYRMQERARIEIEKGNVEAGTRQLQTLAANLLSQGERSLAQTIALEVQRIQQEKNLSAEGGKKIKYGTRALFLASPK
jgi:Ca-activated chloride channel family protein